MAYYGGGKYSFVTVVESCKEKISREFLIYKEVCHFLNPSGENCIEQWLYNETPEEIRAELTGFIAGRLFDTKKSERIHPFFIFNELIPTLAKIYIEMNKDNNWGESEELEGWKEVLKEFHLPGFVNLDFVMVPTNGAETRMGHKRIEE